MIDNKMYMYWLPAAIAQWVYQISFDLWSQALLGLVSTCVGDKLGIPGAAGIPFLGVLYVSMLDRAASFSISIDDDDDDDT